MAILAPGLITASITALTLAPAVHAGSTGPDYVLTRSVPLGAPDRWDYLTFDPATRRVFVAHADRTTVVDGDDGRLLGQVGPLQGAHDQVIVPEIGRGFADSGKDGSVTEFDLKTLQAIGSVPARPDADAMAYDPSSKRLFVIDGDSGVVSAIDAATGKALATIAVGGTLEAAVVDGAGHLFVNQAERRAIARIDTATLKVTAHWPIPGCTSPHGIAVDPQSRRIFTSCVDGKMMVVDASTGAMVQELPIGKGSDALVLDAKRRLVFSSNGDGTLSAIRIVDAMHFGVAPPIPTQPGARTMAIDPASGRLFLVTADATATGAPRVPGGAPSYTFKPGTAHLLMMDPR